MSSEQSSEMVQIKSFKKPGPKNTEETLEIAKKRASELSISKIVIASCTGKTALRGIQVFGPDYKIICVTHVTGFREPNEQEMKQEARQELIAKGVDVFTGQHAFGGVGRGIRNKTGTFQVDEIIAWTLRLFGQGTKVCVEIALMAADTGLVRTDEDIITIGGTGLGADTAAVIRPANSANVFDLKVREIICKPFQP